MIQRRSYKCDSVEELVRDSEEELGRDSEEELQVGDSRGGVRLVIQRRTVKW